LSGLTIELMLLISPPVFGERSQSVGHSYLDRAGDLARRR